MKFVCYGHWNQLPQSAEEFFAIAGKESVFFSRPWFENLTDNGLDKDRSILLACVLDGETLLALLPLEQLSDGHYHTLKHLYTSLASLLLYGSNQQQILDCLVQGLKDLPLTFLQIDPVAGDDSNLCALQEMLQSYGYICQQHYRFYNWFHRTDGESFADYMAARPSRVRNTITRKQRKLKREHGYSISLYTGDDLEHGIADYHSVYNASWKAHEQFVKFIEGLAKRFSEQGWLRLAVLYIGDSPAAAQFWFVAHGKASIFKLVYDETWKKYSPGSILTAYLMRHVIDIDQVEEIDFLTGNDAYKQEWMSERRERFRLCCFTTAKSRSWTSQFMGSLGSLMK